MNDLSRQLYPKKFPDDWACAWGEDPHGLWAVFEVGGVQQTLRWIPPGVFLMGDKLDSAGKDTVAVHGFWLADTACTQELYVAVTGDNPSSFKADVQQPVERVSFVDVHKFIETLNSTQQGLRCRLPKESEWEYACRAGSNSAYWFGDEIEQSQARFGWINDQREELEGTVAVKEYEANPWGLYQLHGNVWEWCDSWYDSDQDVRVVRGGGWNRNAENLRSGRRFGYAPDDRPYSLGFRLARGQ